MNNVPLALSSSHDPQGMRMFSSRLAAAPPMQRRRMLHERLFPLVHQQQPHLAEKITGMLIEMDYSEVLLFLDSPERLAAKVDEVAQVLRLS
ncbi:polyadenylate-binding protein 3-like [Phalaenopsis equestris]|uniref:polyadenylate-binding protein 3-like n=1 Tax=Phalaenopsis equestris TaxID=78828 RepID=UPI0009E2B363|nr:polyadenylate-binding protein 3-like [Phalaenopsis equestris]